MALINCQSHIHKYIDPLYEKSRQLYARSFFLPQPQISSRHIHTAMIEQLGDLDSSHFTVFSRHFNHFTAEAFAEAAIAAMLNIFDLVLVFDFL